MMRLLALFLWVSCFCGGLVSAASASSLTPKDVLQSASTHAPQILGAQESTNIAAASLLEAEGAFDASVTQDIYARIDGFYDGQQIDTQLVKPLAPFNSTLYTGYRISDGSFPIYEDKMITTDDGEWMVGVRMSLLRGREIDARRLGVLNATLQQDNAQATLAKAQLTVQEEALVYYWKWVAAGKKHKVYRTLLNIAEGRQRAFRIRVKKGDMARIYLTENRQYILQRKMEVTNAQREFKEAANRLSLYYRDAEGAPIVPRADQLPSTFLPLTEEAALSALEGDDWIERRPEMQHIQAELQQLDNRIDYGDNTLLPQADLVLEYANDYGSGPASREEAEAIVKFDISIPLQQRKMKGYISQAEAKKRQLAYQKTLLRNELRAQLDNIIIARNTAREYSELAQEEIGLARKMQHAEQTRVNRGDSNYFLLILRDENLAKARIKHITAQLLYHQALARIHALTMNMEALLPKTANADAVSAS